MASGIYLEAGMNTNGTFDVSVRFKTNAPNSHGIRFTEAGLLINKTNTGLTSLVGTWALTLNNTSVTLAGPGGLSGTGTLPTEALDYFSSGFGNNMWALFGAQPYAQSDRVISLSRVKIDGGLSFGANIDQIFTAADTLGDNLRALQEGSTGGVVLKPTNTTWRVQWGLPDTGLYLWSAASLASNAWKYTELTATTQGTNRTVFTTNVSANAGYFRLRNSGPALPAILLESFELAPYTAPNPPYTSVVQSSSAGVTEGSYSMEVHYDSSTTWQWFGQEYDATAYTNWKSRNKLVFDLHRAAETFGWNLELVVSMDGGMGWNQIQVLNWDWLNAGVSKTQTITWDYSAIKAAAPASGIFKLNFMGRGGSGGNFYIDNVRFAE
jgi:hypothetical protein